MKRGNFFGLIDFVCSGVSAGFMSLIVRVVLGSMRWFASSGEQVQVRKSIPVSLPRRLRVGFLERIASASSILNRTEKDELRLRIEEALAIRSRKPTLNRRGEETGIDFLT